MNRVMVSALAFASIVWLASSSVSTAKEESVELRDVPPAVAAAVKARFPSAKVQGAAKEDEDGRLVYEMQLVEKNAKIDVTVSPQGAIELIETQMRKEDLPKEVKRAIADKYPKSEVKLAETVVAVKSGKEMLECYELKLVLDGKTTEVKFAADGKVTHEEVKSGSDDES